MSRSWKGAAVSRLMRQASISPRAVASAITWRAIRGPLLRWRHRRSRIQAGAPTGALLVRRELAWVRALLETATIPSPAVAALTMESPTHVFGRCWGVSAQTLSAIDGRFGVEAWRSQHLQGLAALYWQSCKDPALAAELAQALSQPLAVHLDRSVQSCFAQTWNRVHSAGSGRGPYPMDVGLRALSILIACFALDCGTEGQPVGGSNLSHPGLCTVVQDALETCFADPEYAGDLSNNHHLTSVVCLMLLLASTAPKGHAKSAIVRRHESRLAQAQAWLLRALRSQFDDDGVHFEYSTGYHMCALELLTLAALALLEAAPGQSDGQGAGDAAHQPSPKQRWHRLKADWPELASTLQSALLFAESLLRPDGTYPLIGDYDGSRILRTHVRYRVEASRRRCTTGRLLPVERYLYRTSDGVPLEIEATVTEQTNSRSAADMTRALFEIPPRPIAYPEPAPAKRLNPQESGKHIRVFRGRGWEPAMSQSKSPWRALIVVSSSAGHREAAALQNALGARADETRSCVSYQIALPHLDRLHEIRLFRQAGLAIARGAGFVVTLRSGVPGQAKLGTHSHLDHLASDVWTANGIRIADPGSWCYGASISLRNRYRANSAHFGPLWQADWSESLHHPFFIDRSPPSALLANDAEALWGLMELEEGWVCRIITLFDKNLFVVDASSVVTLSPYPLRTRPLLADGYFGPLVRQPLSKEDARCAA